MGYLPIDIINRIQFLINIQMSVTTKSNRNANKYRVVFLGDQGVGKTSIIERYTSGKFDENYHLTVGIDFNVKDVKRNGNDYRLQIWDTAGQERYRSLIPNYLKNAHCVVFVYDITNETSLNNIKDWHKIFIENQEAPGVIVGNKTDLISAKKVNISGKQLSKQLGTYYIEISAKEGKKITELFHTIIDLIEQSQNKQHNIVDQEQTVMQLKPIKQPENAVELKQPKRQRIKGKCCSSN